MTCCNGNCDQGRQCPQRTPAEACTELGADQPTRPRWMPTAPTALIALVAAAYQVWTDAIGESAARAVMAAVAFPLTLVGVASIVARRVG